MRDIVAQFSPDAAAALRKNASTNDTNEILDLVRRVGASIEPLDPQTNDPQLSRYFVVRVNDKTDAEDVARLLRSLRVTEAAYIKPHEEAP